MNNKIEIKSDFTILHFDEIPILFIGKNYKSDIVIGSLIFEDYDDDTVKYFHSIIPPKLATKFLKGEISYLDVLQKASYLSIVTKDYNDNILKTDEKKFMAIDKSLLPLSSSFCSDINSKTVFKFEGLIEKPLSVREHSKSNLHIKYRRIAKKASMLFFECPLTTTSSYKKHYRVGIKSTSSLYLKNDNYDTPQTSNKFFSNAKFININKLENKNLSHV